jgi:anti-sigma-K factor RskA
MAAGRFRRRREFGSEGQAPAGQRVQGLSTWTLVTLSLAAVAVIALAATALFLGRDAVIALAVICVLVFLGVGWLLG